MNRKEQKRNEMKGIFRSRMVENSMNREDSAAGDAPDGAEHSERRSGKAGRLRIVIIASCVLAAILAGAFLWWRGTRPYRTVREIGFTESAGAGRLCLENESGIVVYSADGVTLVDASGRELWSHALRMSAPDVAVAGEYGVLADIRSAKAVIFDKSGVCAELAPAGNILDMTISRRGLVALHIDASGGDKIIFYDKTGDLLDIVISLTMAQSGFPLDMALSPDGTGLAISTSTRVGGSLKSRIAFYNFSVGKGEPERLVGYFSYDDVLFPQIAYLGEGQVCAVGDDRLCFFSLKNEASPALIKELPLQTELSRVAVQGGHVATLENARESAGQLLRLYDAAGNELFQKSIAFPCLSLSLSGDYVLIGGIDRRLLLTAAGTTKYEGPIGDAAGALFSPAKDTLLEITGAGIRQYRLRY